jgi:hypothetical protein
MIEDGRGEFFALRAALQVPRHKGQVEFAAPAYSRMPLVPPNLTEGNKG